MSQTQLALYGGKPVFPVGRPPWPVPDEQVLEALQQAYADGSWGRYHGPHSESLEHRLGVRHSVKHALLCASGTAAVELALRGLKIGPENEVILAGYDFSGNFRCIEAVGARPVLVDIDPCTWSLDVNQVEDAIGPQTKAVVVSHLHGGLIDMPELCEVAKRRSLAIVEDACQATGAVVYGKPAGAWGDVGVLSFGGSKLLTAGRGGAVLTSRDDVRQRIIVYCDRGNHFLPMSQLQCAVLLPQLGKLSKRNEIRKENVHRLVESCSQLSPLQGVETSFTDSSPSYYKFAWLYNSALCGDAPLATIVAALQAEGVDVGAGFRGFARRGSARCRKQGDLPHSKLAAENTLLLHHPVLLSEPENVDRIALALDKVFAVFSK